MMAAFNALVTLFHREDNGAYVSTVLKNCLWCERSAAQIEGGFKANKSSATVRILCKHSGKIDIAVGDILYRGEIDFTMTDSARIAFLSNNRGLCFTARAVAKNLHSTKLDNYFIT